MLIRSRADHSIYGVVLGDGRGVKISMAAKPFRGESRIGCLFNVTPQCWEPYDGPEALDAYKAYAASGVTPFRDHWG